jgi:hypothetical protein
MLLDRLSAKLRLHEALRRATAPIEKEQYAGALPLLARAAEAGLPDAYQIGRLYLQGSGSSERDCRATSKPNACWRQFWFREWHRSLTSAKARVPLASFSEPAAQAATSNPDFEGAH